MQRYRNLEGHSGVRAYAIRANAIEIEFAGGEVYEYTYAQPGRTEVEAMKRLALAGRGLSTYVSQHVRERYAAKRPAR